MASGFTDYPAQYIAYTSQQSKQLNVVLEIDGLDTKFSLANVYTRVRYGDSGVYYGTPGLVYGALAVRQDMKPLLMFESNLTLSQRLEPEQGRASISQFTFSLVDKDGYVSKVIAPGGGLLDEILGRAVIVKIGYVPTSYPEDYWVAFRGLITQVQIIAGRIILSLGDPNQKRRSAVFPNARTPLVSNINSSTTTIPLTDSYNFYDLIYDESPVAATSWKVKPYLKIDNEVIAYGYGAIAGNTITTLARSGGAVQRGTTPASHTAGAEVTNALEINGHPINIALRIMLSGWGGAPWKTGVAVTALGTVVDPNVTPAANVICLPPQIDADVDYGLVIGDKIAISGSGSGNDGTYTITGFGDSEGYPNRLIYISSSLTLENPATSVTLAFYSQFDIYPVTAGLGLTPQEVDVKTHLKYRDTVFIGPENFFSLYITTQQVGKEYIEKELYLPLGAYSLTRYGRVSMGYTKPPIATDKLIVLNANNIVEPQTISVTRGLNNRKFYNQIQYQYDQADAGNYQKVIRSIDVDSLNLIGIQQLLPINSSGVKEIYGGDLLARRICNRMLSRYKRGAYDIKLSTFWNPGTFIEAGDGVVLVDGGYLKLTDFDDGSRHLTTQVFEVTDRSIDIKTGKVALTLTSGLGNIASGRYGVVSPSSFITATGTTNTRVRVKPSFGNTANEWKKWQPLVGLDIQVHNSTYSSVATRTITALDTVDPNVLVLNSALPFTPGEDWLVELRPYGTGTNNQDQSLVKSVYVYVDATLTVTSGVNNTTFTVSSTDFAKVPLGSLIFVHTVDYSTVSPETTVETLTAPGTIVTADDLGYTPFALDQADLIGFFDGGGPYRLL